MKRVTVFNCREDEKEFFQVYAKQFGFELHPVAEAPREWNTCEAEGSEYVSVTSDSILTEEILQAYHGLGVKHIASRTIGLDHIRLQEAKRLGITVNNVVYSPESVADYAIMMMLMVLRKVKPIMQRFQGQDYSISMVRGGELSDKTVGILGTGKIGKTVARHLSGFGCRILAYDLHPSDDLAGAAEYVSQEELYAQSDIITLHVPATDQNCHMINEKTIGAMKDGVILINTARGVLVDSKALIRGIETGKVSGAGLDVFDGDREIYYRDHKAQLVRQHEMAILNSYPNVLLLPHLAFFTDNAVRDMVRNALYACKCHRDGEAIPWQAV